MTTPSHEVPPALRSADRPGKTTGVLVALGGHVPSSGLWLYTTFTFTFYATPDSVFMVACLVGILYVLLFVGCVVGGVLLLRGPSRDFGSGLLIGWVGGYVALLLGVCLIALLAGF